MRATLAFGVAASVAANVLHAQPNPISQTIAGWPPLALLLTVELVSRIPMHRPLLAIVRVLATAVISGIAAYVSYWHMKGVAAHYGETDASPYLLPVSVDGLIVVASICLVELAARIRHLEDPPTQTSPVPTVAPIAVPLQPGPDPAGWRKDAQEVVDVHVLDELDTPSRPAVAPPLRPPGTEPIRTASTGETRPTPAAAQNRRNAIATLGGPTR